MCFFFLASAEREKEAGGKPKMPQEEILEQRGIRDQTETREKGRVKRCGEENEAGQRGHGGV